MNRSILIVICDFLLLSLLAFSTVDLDKVTGQGAPEAVKADISTTTTNRADAGNDLAAVMRAALEDERKNRDLLLGELTKTRAAATERERQAQTLQQELQNKDQQTQRLQQQQALLQQQFSAAAEHADAQALPLDLETGAANVQRPAGQPRHLPQVLAAGRQAGGVRGLVAGHGGVING